MLHANGKEIYQRRSCPKTELLTGTLNVPLGVQKSPFTQPIPLTSALFRWELKNRQPHVIKSLPNKSDLRQRDTHAKASMKRYAERKCSVKPVRGTCLFVEYVDTFHILVPVDMKVGLTAALDKRGFVCVWRAGQ